MAKYGTFKYGGAKYGVGAPASPSVNVHAPTAAATATALTPGWGGISPPGFFVPVVECDFDYDGIYETDITADIVPESGYHISRGVDPSGRTRSTQLTLELQNITGKYTPQNSSAALYGKVRPQVPLRVTINIGNNTYTLWTGYIKSIKHRWAKSAGVGLRARATLVATDLLDWMTKSVVHSVLVANRYTGAALTAIYQDMGLDPSLYSVDTGLAQLEYHFVREQPAQQAIQDVVNSEMGGTNLLDALGVLRFRDRSHLLGINPLQTWGDNTSIIPNVVLFEQNPTDLLSVVQVKPTVRAGGQANTLIWEMSRNYKQIPPNGIYIAPGATYGPVNFDYASPITSLTAPVANLDYSFTENQNGSGADYTSNAQVTVTDLGAGFSVQIKNLSGANGMYCKYFKLRGQPQTFVVDSPTYEFGKSVINEVTDATQTFMVPYTFDGTICRDYALSLLRTYRYQYPWLTLTFKWRNDDTAVAMASGELLDQIYYSDLLFGVEESACVDDWWRVMAIEHQHKPKTLPVTTVRLVPSSLFRNLDAIAYDLFTRDDTISSLGQATSGDNWANDAGFKISGNKAAPVNAGENYCDMAVGGDTGCMNVEANFSSLAAGAQAGITYLYSDATRTWRISAHYDDAKIYVAKRVAGAWQVVQSADWTPASELEMRVLFQQARHRIYVDAMLVLDFIDADLVANTRAGLYLMGSMTTRIDDWYAGAL